MEIKFKKLVPGAVMPRRAHKSDAGFDLVAVSGGWVEAERVYVYHTGLAFEIPEGYVGLVFPRSSVAKKDLVLSNCVGVIDSGYRGEVLAKFGLANRPQVEDPIYRGGDRIVQLVIMKLPDVEMVEVEELSESDRGEGGYGSTGNQKL